MATVISLPPAAPGDGLPRLRFNQEYRIGARYVLINGSSISRREAGDRYKHDAVLTHFFSRSEPIASPDVFFVDSGSAPGRAQSHMPDTPDMSATGETPEDKYKETGSTVVVSMDDGRGVRSRYLLAAPQPIEMCELHGMFDGLTQFPKNSFSRLNTRPKLATHPWDPNERSDSKNSTNERARREAPYLVDPLAARMMIGFFIDGEATGAPFYSDPISIDLYPGGRQWPNACPVLLDVKAVAIAGPHHEFSQRASIRVAPVDKNGLIRVTIEMEPAEIAEVRAWCTGGETDLAGHAALRGIVDGTSLLIERMGDYASRSASRSAEFEKYRAILKSVHSSVSAFRAVGTAEKLAPTDLFARLLAQAPIHALQHNTRIEAIHAVRKPIIAPKVVNLWAVHQQAVEELGEHPGDDSPDEKVLNAWRTLISSKGLQKDTVVPEDLLRTAVEGSQRI